MTQNSAIAIGVNELFYQVVKNEFKTSGVTMPLTLATLQPYSRSIQTALAHHSGLPNVVIEDLLVELAECLMDNWEHGMKYGDGLPDIDEFELDVGRCVAAITG